jgi:hypothetical protein
MIPPTGDGRGYARTYTWRPLPDLLKVGVWGALLHCMALQCTLWGFTDNFFCLVCGLLVIIIWHCTLHKCGLVYVGLTFSLCMRQFLLQLNLISVTQGLCGASLSERAGAWGSGHEARLEPRVLRVWTRQSHRTTIGPCQGNVLFLGFCRSVLGWFQKNFKLINIPDIMIMTDQEYSLERALLVCYW